MSGRSLTPTCPYCGQPALFVGGAEVYPHRPDLHPLKFWLCRPCDAWVGCHRKGTWQGERGSGRLHTGREPLGRLANGPLRAIKTRAHRTFDPLWKDRLRFGTRREAYAWLADALGLSIDECHIGLFDEDLCQAAIRAVEALHASQLFTTETT